MHAQAAPATPAGAAGTPSLDPIVKHIMRKTVQAATVLLLLGAGVTRAQFGADPFSVRASLEDHPTGRVLRVSIAVPEEHFLYADQTSVDLPDGVDWPQIEQPDAKQKADPFSDRTVDVYEADVSFVYAVDAPPPEGAAVEIAYQGCNATVCFMPRQQRIRIDGADRASPTDSTAPAQPPASAAWEDLLDGRFTIAATTSGYAAPDDFVPFLRTARTGQAPQRNRLQVIFDEQGLWVAMLFILAGGFLLNLTPCVLPMIPVNLAIIGAGAQASSRLRGFLLGGAYGLGIAVVYGLLGIVVLMTGTKFGALNSLPWFNLVIAVIFVVLALAMFDVIHIDLSRWQSKAGPASPQKGNVAAALLLGGVAALLAGACVAPVVIGVLLLSADLVARDETAGMLLPFLLGIGMALPWPFAGAGLSFLPKPGRWMERVKIVFGILILGMALYYGQLGVRQWLNRQASSRADVAAAQAAAAREGGWVTDLDAALREGIRSGKPVFIDFWATWCKNCLKMDKTTFKDAAVEAELQHFVKAKIQAEDITEPSTRAMLDRFDAIGLPTYVVLRPHMTPARPATEPARGEGG